MLKDKRCAGCQNLFPRTLVHFNPSRITEDGLGSKCKECAKYIYKPDGVPGPSLEGIPDISQELADFYLDVANSLATKHIIRD